MNSMGYLHACLVGVKTLLRKSVGLSSLGAALLSAVVVELVATNVPIPRLAAQGAAVLEAKSQHGVTRRNVEERTYAQSGH